MIGKLALEFLSDDGFNELFKKYNLEQKGESVINDRLTFHSLRLASWILSLVRGLFLRRNLSVNVSMVEECISAEHLAHQARAMKKFLNARKFYLLFASLRFYLDSLRLIEFLCFSADIELVQLGKAIEANLFYRFEVISVFKIILQSSQRFTIKALSLVVEANHVLLKLLKKYCTDRGHVFVSKSNRISTDDESDELSSREEGEREFFFEVFLAEYATESIVNVYMRLLKNSQRLEPTTNRYTATMLKRFMVDLNAYQVLFRASLLYAVHEVLYFDDPKWRTKNGELLRVSEAIAKCFVQAVQKDPILMIAIFFNPLRIKRSVRFDKPPLATALPLDITPVPSHWSFSEKVLWLVKCLVDAELSMAVSWLCERLFDAAAIRPVSTDPEQVRGKVSDFYLYTQTGTMKEAFEQPPFRALLLLAECVIPNEEDSNWKIPGSLSADDILRIANTIQSTMRAVVEQQADSLTPSIKRQKKNEDEESASNSESMEEADLPTTLASDLTASVEAQAQATSKWEILKRNNFFLNERSMISDDQEFSDEEDINIIVKNERLKEGSWEKMSKKPPIAINSEDEQD